ncbi:hypothetical protein BDZ89DRAFT_462750 [Hymenopellis radicata]|nr:hypothetical protein BDZ89DRAFT_462750 [Hymenopellis radicata]
MSRKEKDGALSSVTYKLFCAMFDDIVFDHALEAHRYAAQARTVCTICNTTCNGAHLPGSSSMNTPSKSDSNGNIFLDCTVCSNKIASNRYAAHLTTCMGLSTSRRSGARTNPKSVAVSEAGGRSASPSSDMANLSEDRPLKSKSKSKTKRVDEAEFNLKRKRASPQTTPNKKQKQQRGSPMQRVKSDGDGMFTNVLPKSQSKAPSKLRASSTASFLESPSSRASSPGGSVATPGSSFSAQSPTFTSRGLNVKKGPPKGTGPPRRPKQVTPPLVSHPVASVIDYMQDEAGDETGSSTDTSDSS